MAKIKINKLPKGFKLEGNQVVEDQLMRDGGGLTTGDQADYGLVTTPQQYYGETTFNNSDDESVRYSLSGVPRENANIEAEGGETVLTDLNDDGSFGLYNIKGPRHSQGGVPMFLPEQSFIYSDTPKMKFSKDEMAEFGITGSKRTPANISKRFELNDYYGELNSQYGDEISSRSAELMLKKNMENLSKLSFIQEAKKNFESGVPLAAHPFLMMEGIDPLEFTAKIENISKQKAEENMIAEMSPEDQQQLMMMKQLMVQEQQQGQQQQQPQEPPMAMSRFGSELDTLPTAQKGRAVTASPYTSGSKQDIEYKKLAADGYKFEIVDNKLRYYKLGSSKYDGQQGNTEGESIEISGTGKRGSINNESDVEVGNIINESGAGYFNVGKFSGSKIPQIQTSEGRKSWYGSEAFASKEAEEDFMDRNGKIVAQIEGFEYNKGKDDPQWGKFQKLYEEGRKIFSTKLGIPYVPYFGDGSYGSNFDSLAGAKVFNAPGYDVDFVKGDDGTMNLPEEVIEIEDYKLPPPEYWKQDLVNLDAINSLKDNPYLPFNQKIDRVKGDYALRDSNADVGLISATARSLANAYGTAGGTGAIANSNIFGDALQAAIGSQASIGNANIGIMNATGARNAQLNYQQNANQAKLDKEFYDNTQRTLQDMDNFDNWKIGKNAELYNTALTNRANTANLNSVYSTFNTNPNNSGLIEFTGTGNQLYQNPKVDQDEAFRNMVADYETNNPTKTISDQLEARMWDMTHGVTPNTNQTRGQRDFINSNGATQYSTQRATGKFGKEQTLKKWASKPHFFSGKMGA